MYKESHLPSLSTSLYDNVCKPTSGTVYSCWSVEVSMKILRTMWKPLRRRRHPCQSVVPLGWRVVTVEGCHTTHNQEPHQEMKVADEATCQKYELNSTSHKMSRWLLSLNSQTVGILDNRCSHPSERLNAVLVPRCHTPCTLWRSCHNTSTSTRRAMQSTTSRKNWWLVDYSHVLVQICSDEIMVLDGFGVTSKLKSVISNAGVWLGHSLDFFLGLHGTRFEKWISALENMESVLNSHLLRSFLCWGFILGELWGLHQTCGSELATWLYWTPVGWEIVYLSKQGLKRVYVSFLEDDMW